MKRIEVLVSGCGLGLSAIGMIAAGWFPIIFVGIVLTAVGFGMLVRGAS